MRAALLPSWPATARRAWRVAQAHTSDRAVQQAEPALCQQPLAIVERKRIQRADRIAMQPLRADQQLMRQIVETSDGELDPARTREHAEAGAGRRRALQQRAVNGHRLR